MATVQKGQIFRQDLDLWDGVTKTDTRIGATGGTVTGLKIGDHIDILTVYGASTEYTLATLNAAIPAVASNNVTFLFSTGTWAITDDLTIPANITCYIPAGCVLDVSSGKTLTISGAIQRESDTWTSGLGTVSYTASNNVLVHQSDLSNTADITQGAALIGNAVQIVNTLAILKSLTGTANRDIYVRGRTANNDGYQGTFVWDSSDLSTEVTADSQNGVYVPPDSDNTGASGAWVRYFRKDMFATWFGVTADGSTDDTTAAQAAADFAIARLFGTLIYPGGSIIIDALDFSGAKDIEIRGEGMEDTIFKARSGGTRSTNGDAESVFIAFGLGSGGAAGTHTTENRRTYIHDFSVDANGQAIDLGTYHDKNTDCEYAHISIYNSSASNGFTADQKINFSWINEFRHYSIKDFLTYGVEFTGNNINAIKLESYRNTADVENSTNYYLRGNSLTLINCDAEGSATTHTGMDVYSSRVINLIGCHFEGGSPSLKYGSGGAGAVRGLNIRDTLFFGSDTAAITSDNYAEMLNITGCEFEGANSTVELHAIRGEFSQFYFEDAAGYTYGGTWGGVVHDESRELHRDRAWEDWQDLGSMSTSAGTPTTLFTGLPAGGGFVLHLAQRVSSTVTVTDVIVGNIDEGGTLDYVVHLEQPATALGLTLTVALSGSTYDLKCYGTYSGQWSAKISVIQHN